MCPDFKKSEKGLKKNGEYYFYQCSLCQLWFKEKGNLIEHHRMRHSEQEHVPKKKYRCIHCNKYFSQRQLLIHKRKFHSRNTKTLVYGYESYIRRQLDRPKKKKERKNEASANGIITQKEVKEKKKILNKVRPISKGSKRRPPDWFGRNRRAHDKH